MRPSGLAWHWGTALPSRMLLVLLAVSGALAETTTEVVTYNQNITECSVPLTSISPWPMGQCGQRTTADPRVFGPETWRTLHRFAQNFPTAPDPEVSQRQQTQGRSPSHSWHAPTHAAAAAPHPALHCRHTRRA